MQEVRPLKRDGIVARNLGEECILYDETHGGMHVVNSVAGLVLELCDGQHTVEQMEARVREAFAVADGTDVRGDLDRILAQFAELKVLAPPAAAA